MLQPNTLALCKAMQAIVDPPYFLPMPTTGTVKSFLMKYMRELKSRWTRGILRGMYRHALSQAVLMADA